MIHLSPQQARQLEARAGLSDYQRAAHLVRELRPLWSRLSEAQRQELRRRLEAAKLAGWSTIPANIVALDDLDAELAEIDENLIRNELTVLERGEHLKRREEILLALGQRQKAGDNQYTAGGEQNSPPLKTTAAIAPEAGIGERTAQHYKQIAHDLDEQVRDQIRDLPLADRKTDLLRLARLEAQG